MKIAIALTFSVLTTLVGCDSGSAAKLQADQAHFEATAQAQIDNLQWKVDDATAAEIFDDGTDVGMNRYLTFRKCHEEPPSHAANKKICAAIQARVSQAEARSEAQDSQDKAKW
jgi:hypothetical protein